jgi:sulfate transport system permease protein
VGILAVSLTFFAVFLLLPLIAVFVEALRKGWDAYWRADRAGRLSAIKLTLLAAAIAVPLNLVFGVARPGRSPSSSSAASTC